MAEKEEEQILEQEQTAEENNVDEVCLQNEDVEKVLEAIVEKNRLIEETNERYKRLQADFENFKRRTRQEKEELGIVVTGEVVSTLLPVIDNFGRALQSEVQDASALLTGIDMIYKQFMQTLEKVGVVQIEAVGKQFDPKLHEAVMRMEDSETEDGIIVEELQPGYEVLGRVVRPSMVKVVNNS